MYLLDTLEIFKDFHFYCVISLFHHEEKDESTKNRNHMLIDMRKEEACHKSSIQKLKNHDIKQNRKNTCKNILCPKGLTIIKSDFKTCIAEATKLHKCSPPPMKS